MNTANVSGGKSGERECAVRAALCVCHCKWLNPHLPLPPVKSTQGWCPSHCIVPGLHKMLWLSSPSHSFGACRFSTAHSIPVYIHYGMTERAALTSWHQAPGIFACSLLTQRDSTFPTRDGPLEQPVLLHQTVKGSGASLAQPEHGLPPLSLEISRDPLAGLCMFWRQGGTGQSPVYTEWCIPCSRSLLSECFVDEWMYEWMNTSEVPSASSSFSGGNVQMSPHGFRADRRRRSLLALTKYYTGVWHLVVTFKKNLLCLFNVHLQSLMS